MTISRFTATDFRCLQTLDVELAPTFNLVSGKNASGKTSFLEALAYLGRGRSFRGAPPAALVQHGKQEFVLFGRVTAQGREIGVGVQNGSGGFEARIDSENAASTAELADVLPLQVIDPDIHDLVSGGPELRRRFIDWVAFHVEQGFLDVWRRFRRALKQRNAALKSPGSRSAITAWDAEYVRLGLAVDEMRRQTLLRLEPVLRAKSDALLDVPVSFDYAQGWGADQLLGDALAAGFERDSQQGNTQAGPHRADLKLRLDDRVARRLVSRGQQKLLASTMVLAATEVVQASLDRPVMLLMDDPAAELDRASLSRLMSACFALGGQMIVTSLEPDLLSFPTPPRRFHVEQGVLAPE